MDAKKGSCFAPQVLYCNYEFRVSKIKKSGQNLSICYLSGVVKKIYIEKFSQGEIVRFLQKSNIAALSETEKGSL